MDAFDRWLSQPEDDPDLWARQLRFRALLHDKAAAELRLAAAAADAADAFTKMGALLSRSMEAEFLSLVLNYDDLDAPEVTYDAV